MCVYTQGWDGGPGPQHELQLWLGFAWMVLTPFPHWAFLMVSCCSAFPENLVITCLQLPPQKPGSYSPSLPFWLSFPFLTVALTLHPWL